MQDLAFFIQVGLFLWIVVLTFICFWIFRYFKMLSKDVSKGNLITVLERILETEKNNTKKSEELFKSLNNFEEKSKLYIQKVNLVRFNPFKELGGEHSFAITLLDAKDNGVIITGLHTRERTRVYVKSVKKGKVDMELSEEEKKSLVQAQKLN